MSRLLSKNNLASERLCRRTYGCSVTEYWRVRGHSAYRGSPVEQFVVQRRTARDRGIEWRLSLLEWWEIWATSGKYEKRGRGGDRYVMARHGDSGPYSVGNVSIQSGFDNRSESAIRTNAFRAQNMTSA
jgi:hypothetical protein